MQTTIAIHQQIIYQPRQLLLIKSDSNKQNLIKKLLNGLKTLLMYIDIKTGYFLFRGLLTIISMEFIFK